MIGILKTIGAVLADVTKQSITTSSGDYDPARVIGYFGAGGGFIMYFVITIVYLYKNTPIDLINWATGFAAVSTACIAAAIGVKVKESSERKPGDPDPNKAS